MGLYFSKTTQEDGLYIRGETYGQFEIVRDVDDSGATDPSSISFSLTDPCGVVLVDNQPMTKDSASNYHYYYPIGISAAYGRYESTVSASDADGNVSKWVRDFFIFPWGCNHEVRRKSGIEENKTISDIDLSSIIWDAYEEVLSEIYEFHDWEKFISDPSLNGILFNGTNTTVRINLCNYDELADRDGDGTVRGYGEVSCGTDVDAYWIDSNYARQQARVTIVDVITGRCTVTQNDGVTAIPANNNGVRVNYWTKNETWNERLMRIAVVYLACHETCKRFSEMDRATLVDMASNRTMFLTRSDRFKRLYEKNRDRVRGIMFGGCK